MAVTIELRDIKNETQANYAMISCEEPECQGIIAIGMINTSFSSLKEVKAIATLHNEVEGCENHRVKLALQNIVR